VKVTMKIPVQNLSALITILMGIYLPLIAIAKPSGDRPKSVSVPTSVPKPIPKPVVGIDGCYFVNSAGKVINLNTLCGLNEVNKGAKGIFQAKIKRREGGIPVIDVTFGNQNFEMILDTGASATIITANMATAIGVVPTGVNLFNTVAANNVEVKIGYVKTIEVGGLVAKNVLVGIVPSLPIGLLGQDFFGSYDVTVKKDVIEFRANTSTFKSTK
jgi:gag-polyprotein putative aspartyl protease